MENPAKTVQCVIWKYESNEKKEAMYGTQNLFMQNRY